VNLVFPTRSASILKVFTAWINFTRKTIKIQGPTKKKGGMDGYSQVSEAKKNLPIALPITKIPINHLMIDIMKRDFALLFQS